MIGGQSTSLLELCMPTVVRVSNSGMGVAVALTQIALCTTWSTLNQKVCNAYEILVKQKEHPNKNMLTMYSFKSMLLWI